MKLAESFGAVQCGVTTINRVRIPVYRLESGAEVVEQADSVSGRPEIISVAGARLFKSQEYAFHPDIEPGIVDGVFSRPVALLDEEEQAQVGEDLLRALFSRVIASGTDFEFMGSKN